MQEKYSLHTSPQLDLASRDGIAVVLSEKDVFALFKKSRSSGIPFDVLQEVYTRGYQEWDKNLDPNPESAAFGRVNSFIAGGLAADIDEDLKNTCWKGYEAVGTKKKNGKTVPNCVPVKEDAEKHSKDPDKPSSRFDGSNELVSNYKKQTPGQIVKRVVKEALEEDKKGHFSPSGGMTQAGVNAYNRKTGGHLQTAVTTKPSKLKKGSKAAKRRKSFCARMGGMKKRLTSAKTARDPDSRINKALRKWNCEETQTNEMYVRDPSGKKIDVKKQKFRGADNKMHSAYPGKSSSSGGGDE